MFLEEHRTNLVQRMVMLKIIPLLTVEKQRKRAMPEILWEVKRYDIMQVSSKDHAFTGLCLLGRKKVR